MSTPAGKQSANETTARKGGSSKAQPDNELSQLSAPVLKPLETFNTQDYVDENSDQALSQQPKPTSQPSPSGAKELQSAAPANGTSAQTSNDSQKSPVIDIKKIVPKLLH